MPRWNLAVSSQTDQAVRLFLAHQGRARKGDLSRFIEEAVQAHILELTAQEAKQANADLDPPELESMVQEALDWAKD
jgi:hypothetical protein